LPSEAKEHGAKLLPLADFVPLRPTSKPASPPPLERPPPLSDAALQLVNLLPYNALVSAPPPRIANLKSGCSDGMLLLAATACLVARRDEEATMLTPKPTIEL